MWLDPNHINFVTGVGLEPTSLAYETKLEPPPVYPAVYFNMLIFIAIGVGLEPIVFPPHSIFWS